MEFDISECDFDRGNPEKYNKNFIKSRVLGANRVYNEYIEQIEEEAAEAKKSIHSYLNFHKPI